MDTLGLTGVGKTTPLGGLGVAKVSEI